MKAVILYGPGNIEVKEVPNVKPKEDEILIRNYLDLQPDYQKRIKKYYEKKEL